MSFFTFNFAREILPGTIRLLTRSNRSKNICFCRIFTSLSRWNTSFASISFRRYLITSSKLFLDESSSNNTEVPEEGVTCSKKEHQQVENSINPDSMDAFLETYLLEEETSFAQDETSEPDKLEIEAYAHVHEQASPRCPGCGIVFQSEDPGKPGYVIPAKNPTKGDQGTGSNAVHLTRTLICQKCFDLKYYNKPFPISVSSAEIIENLRHLQRKKGLILYVVDLIDLPGSLFTNLLETIGEAKRIIIVGNKIDMLPVDGHTGKQKEHLYEMLFTTCKAHGLDGANIRSVCLVSAKTGFGMLQLASKILEHWDHKGDIYLVGCSNTGKTSLFNLLLDLFSVYKKADLLQRATVSLWPCTTQSMLRFPISHWMLKKLCTRLREGVDKKSDDVEIEIDKEIIDKQETSYKERQSIRKMRGSRGKNMLVPSHSVNKPSGIAVIQPSFVMDQPNKNQTWLYDTPGIVSDKQISSLLTIDELKLLNPTLWLIPRTFILKPGQSLMLGGLGRVDYLEIKRRKKNNDEEWDTIPMAIKSVFFTVLASPNLPVHICKEPQADQVYEKHAGSELLGIPRGGRSRMEIFPSFKSEEFTVKGLGWDTCAADVVLSNLGWVAVTAGSGSVVSLRAHTPNRIGIDIREPALLPTIVSRRGSRGVRYQGYPSPERYEATRKRNPQFIKKMRGQPLGESKWVQEIKRIRQEQRALLKFEKRRRAATPKLLQRSAVSEPPEIPTAFGIPLPQGKLRE